MHMYIEVSSGQYNLKIPQSRSFLRVFSLMANCDEYGLKMRTASNEVVVWLGMD